ncbi:MAG: hypothetical protein E4H36_10110 [Spirochaetales bacterium]|nr:MAG: hypothetical protein E4H36_10110 [Spirochaetales bacterium]
MLVEIFKQLLGRVEFIAACIFIMLLLPVIFALGAANNRPPVIRKVPQKRMPAGEKKSPQSSLIPMMKAA